MTEIRTVTDLRNGLQERADELDIEVTRLLLDRGTVLAQLEILDQTMALVRAEADAAASPQAGGVAEAPAQPREAEQTHWTEDMPPMKPVSASPIRPAPPARQRQAVRGPVLALLRAMKPSHTDGLTGDEIIKCLPDLATASIRAALKAAVAAGKVETSNGLYWVKPTHEQPAPAPEREGYAGLIDAGLYRSDPPPHPRYFAAGDQAALRAADFGSQSDALRAAVEKAGPMGLIEDNTFVNPAVIAAAIDEGWLDRTDDDRGARLWLRGDRNG